MPVVSRRLLVFAFTAVLALPAGIGVVFAQTPAPALAPAPAQKRPVSHEKELKELYDRGGNLYHVQKQHEEGMKLFLELETKAKNYGSASWEGTALWKQAQYWADAGDSTRSTELFEKCRTVKSRSGTYVGSASDLLLLGNIYGMYQLQGKQAEASRIQRQLIASTEIELRRIGFKLADRSLFDLDDTELAGVQRMAYIGIVFEREVRERFEAGDDAGALALGEKIARRYGDTQVAAEVTIYVDVLEDLVRIHLAAGNTDAAEKVLQKLLVVAKTPKAESYDELLGTRIHYAWLRFQRGEEPAPLFAEINTAMEELKSRRWIEREVDGRGIIARMKARTGDFPEAKKLLDSSIDQLRPLDMPTSLATLLLTRAELTLDAGITEGVDVDIYQAAFWYRQRGGLRAETQAYVQYVRYLRARGRVGDALAALARARERLERFPNAEQTAALNREEIAIAGLISPDAFNPFASVGPRGGGTTITAITAGGGGVGVAGANAAGYVGARTANTAAASAKHGVTFTDLQPIQVSTRMIDGWPTAGRFTLTNAGDTTVSGTLEANSEGAPVTAKWDSTKLEWLLEMAPPSASARATLATPAAAKSADNVIKQEVTLRPLEQATITVSLNPNPGAAGGGKETSTSSGVANSDLNKPATTKVSQATSATKGRLKLQWRTATVLQTARWNFAPGADDADIAVTDANLGIESPFYSVPLHHFIRRTDPSPELIQNLRVITSVQCRVELVDAASGKILAVDATGDGSFKGGGDVILSDHDGDGFPDIAFAKDEAAHAIEIQLYPMRGSAEILAKIELRNDDGTWSLRTTDRVIGKK